MPSVTTANVAVCKKCGTVLGVEGYYSVSSVCPSWRSGDTSPAGASHQVAFVPVVVPLP